MLLKIEPSEITPFLHNNFSHFGGTFTMPPPGGAWFINYLMHSIHSFAQMQISFHNSHPNKLYLPSKVAVLGYIHMFTLEKALDFTTKCTESCLITIFLLHAHWLWHSRSTFITLPIAWKNQLARIKGCEHELPCAASVKIERTYNKRNAKIALSNLYLVKIEYQKITLENCEIEILPCQIRCEKYINKTKHINIWDCVCIVIISSIAWGFKGFSLRELEVWTFGVEEKHILLICITYLLLFSFV